MEVTSSLYRKTAAFDPARQDTVAAVATPSPRRIPITRKRTGTGQQNSLPATRDFLLTERLQRLIDSSVINGDIERHSPRTLGNKRERLSRLVWLASAREWRQISVGELQQFFLYLNHGHKDEGGRWGQARGKACRIRYNKDLPRNLSRLLPVVCQRG